jgi:hypothetical protein
MMDTATYTNPTVKRTASSAGGLKETKFCLGGDHVDASGNAALATVQL